MKFWNVRSRPIRWGLAVALATIILGLGYAWLVFQAVKPAPPQRMIQGRPAGLHDYHRISFDILAADPFAGGKVWISAMNERGEYQNLIFNIETSEIEAHGGRPLAWDEQDRIALYSQREISLRAAGQQGGQDWLTRWMNQWMPGYANPTDRVAFWIESAGLPDFINIGMAHERSGGSGGAQASPRADYYRIWTTADEHLLIDLKKAKLITLPPTDSWMGGWWSDHEILYISPTGDLMIYDTATRQPRILFASNQIASFVQGQGLILTNSNHYGLFPAWDGREFQFFLGPSFYLSQPNWLARIDKTIPRMTLVTKTFPYSRLGRFDSLGKHYVHCGEPDTNNSNAVYIHDLATSRTTTLVPSTPGASYLSVPNFYKDKIIFRRDDALWIMNLDGNGQRVLFPPPAN